MITPETREQLQGLNGTSYGKALKDYLNEELGEIQNLQTIKSWEETLGRQYAEKVILKLLAIMEKENTKGLSKNQYV